MTADQNNPNSLRIPLTIEMVRAANLIYLQLDRWQTADRAFAVLHTQVPGFNPEATLLKVASVNALYWAQLYAIDRMSRHIEHILQEIDIESAGIELVEAIADLPMTDSQKHHRKHTSFASKFLHFFVSRERFPIYDSVADWMVRQHLKRNLIFTDSANKYLAFCKNLDQLKVTSKIDVTNSELDRYLWLAGSLRKWKAGKIKEVNTELSDYFTHHQKESNVLLMG